MSAHLVVVTGGSSGLGRAVLAAAPPGAHRVDVSRRGAGDDAEAHIAADLAEVSSWARVGDEIDALISGTRWDRVTVVHSAGVLTPIGFAGEVDTDAYTRNVLVNSAATQVLGHRFVAACVAADTRAEVLFVSSGAARGAPPGWSSYGAAKAATEAWVRTVGAEQQLRGGVRVLAVAPGVVATAMQDEIRSMSSDAFPSVERFQRMHDEGALRDAAQVARELWAVLDGEAHASGAVLDLRSLADG